MSRYLVRQGNTGRGWLVWDRVKRGPAVVEGRELARLPHDDANIAIALLNGANFDAKSLPMPSAWQLTYSDITVNCRDEQDAKRLARLLLRKGFRVTARTVEGATAGRSIPPDEIANWVSSRQP